jgi:(methylthio)acryloyl-CoA hydratase
VNEHGLVTLDIQDDIALVGLNRPRKCNAINQDLAEELSRALTRANGEAKVGIIYGHGAHFCAGIDLDWMRNTMEEYAAGLYVLGQPRKSHGPLLAIAESQIPFIAAIQGAAIGLGFELAAAAHIRIADATASFALPEGRRGIFVGGGGAARISRLIGVARMQDLMLTGRKYNAADSLQFNVVQYTVPAGDALSKAIDLAKEILKNSAPSNFAILRGLPRLGDMTVDDAIFWEGILAKTTFGIEARARISQFLQPLPGGDRSKEEGANT